MIAPLIDELAVEYGDRLRTVRRQRSRQGAARRRRSASLPRWRTKRRSGRGGLRARRGCWPLHCSAAPPPRLPPRLLQLKINTDESPAVATEYGIRSIPTVMIFKDGQKMDAVIGAVPKATLVQTIESESPRGRLAAARGVRAGAAGSSARLRQGAARGRGVQCGGSRCSRGPSLLLLLTIFPLPACTAEYL